ncbi:MAG: hypothetical protein AT711_03005 [Thermoproteus sp. CIS_19]|nr:MAG: hypothetical protein AT711_03005 [Thermoproteus sp. CIS_19]
MPNLLILPTSFRARSTNIICSASSFSSESISSSSLKSSLSSAPLGLVPAIGWVSTTSPSTLTNSSGEVPIRAISPYLKKNIYGDGFIEVSLSYMEKRSPEISKTSRLDSTTWNISPSLIRLKASETAALYEASSVLYRILPTLGRSSGSASAPAAFGSPPAT